MNALAHLASLLDLTEDEVNDLTNAILAVESRPLSAVQADIRTVEPDRHPNTEYLRSVGRFPPALDALVDFIRSQAPTNPQLQKEIENLGQIASDLFARFGSTGCVSHRIRAPARSLVRVADQATDSCLCRSGRGCSGLTLRGLR